MDSLAGNECIIYRDGEEEAAGKGGGREIFGKNEICGMNLRTKSLVYQVRYIANTQATGLPGSYT